MVEPAARIRPVTLDDQKHIRFLVGKSTMEPIAVANRKMYTNPFLLAIWVALSCVWVQLKGWWPNPEHGMLSFLAPIPAFGSLSIAFMFAVDWLNRWGFEDRSNEILRRPDLVDIPAYYSRSPASGFWVLQYGERFIGLIGLDASLDAESNAGLADAPQGSKQARNTNGTSRIATIRHFYVAEEYRRADLADDLLAHALKHAFGASEKPKAVRAFESPLEAYIKKALQKQHFSLEKKAERVGALKWWQNSVQILSRDVWSSLSSSS